MGPDCTSEQSITMWSDDHIGAPVGLNREEKAQKKKMTVRLLELLDPAYEGVHSRPMLGRVLALHSERSAYGKSTSEEAMRLLDAVLTLRRRDFAYCKYAFGCDSSAGEADESHAYFIRSLMQLRNMYHPNSFSYEEFASYFLDQKPECGRTFIWQQREQKGLKDLTGHWRRGSASSVSSQGSASSDASSSIYSARFAASSASSLATQTSCSASDRIEIVRPSTSGPRLEGNSKAVYIPPARRGSEDIMKKTSWR